MMSLQNIIAVIFISCGFLYMAIAALGVIKFPDFFTRLHAAGVGDTFGALLITFGIIIYTGFKLLSLKVFIIFFILLLTNPLGTNLIMLAAVYSHNYQNYNYKKRLKNNEGDTDRLKTESLEKNESAENGKEEVK